jgi:hypothetical protein
MRSLLAHLCNFTRSPVCNDAGPWPLLRRYVENRHHQASERVRFGGAGRGGGCGVARMVAVARAVARAELLPR